MVVRFCAKHGLTSMCCFSSWEAVAWATQAKCMVIFRDGACVMHVGCMAPGHSPGSATPGPICKAVANDGVGNYLANLALFPGMIFVVNFHNF